MNEIIEKITKYFCFGTIKCLEFIKRLYICRFVKIKYLKIERSYLKNRNEDTTLKFLLRSIATILILLIFVMLFPSKFMYFTGGKTKLELLEFIGWGISGIIAIFGVIGLLQRAAALDAQNKLTEKGHAQERFKAATEHLSSDSISARIAAFSAFHHIAKIEKELKDPIFDILCSHLRQTTKDKDYQKKQIKPTEEMQSLLNILFVHDSIFYDMNAGSKGTNLKSVNLESTNLKGVNLEKMNLQNANLHGANLHGANLHGANLKDANLREAKINEHTITPDGWENDVKKHGNELTCILFVDDKDNIIKLL